MINTTILNLVKRDFAVSKFYLIVAVLVWILYGVQAFMFNMYAATGLLFTMFLPSIFIIMDTFFKAEIQFCSFPVKRTTVVYARYISSLILIMSGLILTAFLGLIFDAFLSAEDKSFKILMTWPGIAGFLFSVILFISIIMPFIFRFGLVKGLVIFVSAVVSCILVITVIEYIISVNQGYVMFTKPYFRGITRLTAEYINSSGTLFLKIQSAAVLIAVPVLSVFLSKRFYNKRDL